VSAKTPSTSSCSSATGSRTTGSSWPEDRVLVAHQLDGAGYRVIATLSGETTARVPPFDAIELDLACILGG